MLFDSVSKRRWRPNRKAERLTSSMSAKTDVLTSRNRRQTAPTTSAAATSHRTQPESKHVGEPSSSMDLDVREDRLRHGGAEEMDTRNAQQPSNQKERSSRRTKNSESLRNTLDHRVLQGA